MSKRIDKSELLDWLKWCRDGGRSLVLSPAQGAAIVEEVLGLRDQARDASTLADLVREAAETGYRRGRVSGQRGEPMARADEINEIADQLLRREDRPSGRVTVSITHYREVCAELDARIEALELERDRWREQRQAHALEVQNLEAERDRLARILAVERGDESAAPEGWRWRKDDAVWLLGHSRSATLPFHAEIGDGAAVVARSDGSSWYWGALRKTDDPLLMSPDAGEWEWIEIANGECSTALEAIEAADAALKEVAGDHG